LQSGDGIVALAGVPGGGVDDLHRLLRGDRAGRAVPCDVLRAGRVERLVVTPAETGPPRTKPAAPTAPADPTVAG